MKKLVITAVVFLGLSIGSGAYAWDYGHAPYGHGYSHSSGYSGYYGHGNYGSYGHGGYYGHGYYGAYGHDGYYGHGYGHGYGHYVVI